MLDEPAIRTRTVTAGPANGVTGGDALGETTLTGQTVRPRTVWLVAFLAFLLIGVGWAVALPLNGTNDEDQHIRRAYAVASGQIYSPPAPAVRGGGAWFLIPRSLLPENVDCPQREERAASCQVEPPDDPSRVVTGSAAGRYNPLYYLPVGAPMVVSPDLVGIIAGRIVSAAMVAACLAFAVLIAVRRRSPMLLAAVLLAATPNLLNLGGSINPSGLELAAGVLIWTALLALVRARDGEFDEVWTRRLLQLAALGAAVLLSIRTLGPLLLALTLLGCLLIARPGRVRALAARRDSRLLTVGLAGVGLYGVGWTLVSGVLDNPPQPAAVRPLSFTEQLGWIAHDRLTQWVAQVVGRFSYGEISAPYGLLVTWYGLALVILVPTLLLATRRQVAVVVGTVLTSMALLVGFELAYYDLFGWAQQSRYVLPFGVGALLAAGALRRWERTLGPTATRRFVLTVAAVTGVLHLWALAVVMTRFQVEQRFKALLPLDGYWLPATGPQLPLLAVVCGGVALVALVMVARRPLRAPAPDPRDLTGPNDPADSPGPGVHPGNDAEGADGEGQGDPVAEASERPTTVSGNESGSPSPTGEERTWPVPASPPAGVRS